MVTTEAGTRARCEELFQQAVDRIPVVESQLRETRTQLDSEQGLEIVFKHFVARRSFPIRAGLHILDTLGLRPIVPNDLRERIKRVSQSYTNLTNERESLEEGLKYHGRHLPGTHALLDLEFNPIENHHIPYWATFVIQVPIGESFRIITPQAGEFSRLQYQTAPKQYPEIDIPRPDKEAPTLLLPEGYAMRIRYVGYAGLGQYDRYENEALFKPVNTKVAKPIDPKEFVLA